jgi:hypothetical protein
MKKSEKSKNILQIPKIYFSRKYIARLAVAAFIMIIAVAIFSTTFTIRMMENNPNNTDRVIFGGIATGVLIGVVLIVVPAPFYLHTLKTLGERLDSEKENSGMRMPISDEMICRINTLDNVEVEDRLFKMLEYDWLESVDKVRKELERVKKENGVRYDSSCYVDCKHYLSGGRKDDAGE